MPFPCKFNLKIAGESLEKVEMTFPHSPYEEAGPRHHHQRAGWVIELPAIFRMLALVESGQATAEQVRDLVDRAVDKTQRDIEDEYRSIGDGDDPDSLMRSNAARNLAGDISHAIGNQYGGQDVVTLAELAELDTVRYWQPRDAEGRVSSHHERVTFLSRVLADRPFCLPAKDYAEGYGWIAAELFGKCAEVKL